MTTELGVNEHHRNVVINYLRFARYQRAQRLKAVDDSFKNLEESRLEDDETFTKDEVVEILDGLLTVVRSEVEDELINTSHTNVLMLRQLFIEAEKWHLKLSADISELENRELLEKIADFEEQEFSGTKRDTEFNLASMKLEPLNETGQTALLHLEINRLKEENLKLRDVLRDVEERAMSLTGDRGKLAADLERIRAAQGIILTEDGTTDDIAKLQQQIEKYKLDIKQSAGREGLDPFESELISLKHEFLRIKHMLDMKEEELEKKVSQTVQFKNVQSMLRKKNEQLKDLRKRLMKYESLDDD
ncbi:leucine zipper transcription factor-like protein 1 [Tubulanus polymorphus]|uniref:leucine zipper transcription factor-like protein 1 n=1 Tax=Tubulanus polymorphus TaxID=672921 RepID=UPI003DA45074